MAGSQKLPKSERICSDSRIEALFKGGRWGRAEPLRYCWAAGEAGGEGSGECPAARPDVKPGVSILVSVPKKSFKRAWKRNLIKRRIKESYRQRKEPLAAAAMAGGHYIEIAFICAPEAIKGAAGVKTAAKTAATAPEIPDFKTLDRAVTRITEQIVSRL